MLIKIRVEFIQEALSKYPSHQSRLQSTQWTSSILDSFLAYLYYCGSVDPHRKSHMMSILLDDPQTYSKSGWIIIYIERLIISFTTDWHIWSENQKVPGLWGALPDHPIEYQAATLKAVRAGIALEPNVESSGLSSKVWCKGIMGMMVQAIPSGWLCIYHSHVST